MLSLSPWKWRPTQNQLWVLSSVWILARFFNPITFAEGLSTWRASESIAEKCVLFLAHRGGKRPILQASAWMSNGWREFATLRYQVRHQDLYPDRIGHPGRSAARGLSMPSLNPSLMNSESSLAFKCELFSGSQWRWGPEWIRRLALWIATRDFQGGRRHAQPVRSSGSWLQFCF